jgi:hypothetical protein
MTVMIAMTIESLIAEEDVLGRSVIPAEYKDISHHSQQKKKSGDISAFFAVY